MKTTKFMHKMAAAATTGAIVASSTGSFAGVGFDKTAEQLAASTTSFTRLITLTSYIAGTGLAVAGVFKLKQHVDNPGQVMMKDGLVRLGAGGGLLSLPFVMDAMSQSITDDRTTGVDFSDLSDNVTKTDLGS
jgi:hypothetical protein